MLLLAWTSPKLPSEEGEEARAVTKDTCLQLSEVSSFLLLWISQGSRGQER